MCNLFAKGSKYKKKDFFIKLKVEKFMNKVNLFYLKSNKEGKKNSFTVLF